MANLNLRLLTAAIAIMLSAFTLTAAPPAIEVTPAGLRASGITPGADAVWFGATIDTFAMTRRLKRHAAIVRDTDGDGVVLYELPQLSRFSLLLVADATTGEYAVFHGDGVRVLEQDFRGNNWRAGLEDFDVPADSLEILLLRPGVGAWTMSGAEGGRNDGDGKPDGKFRLRMKDMDPIGGVARPQGSVRIGDLLVLLDPQTFAFTIRLARE